MDSPETNPDQKDIGSWSTMHMIENAASVDALQECIMRHSTMLQTTGCLKTRGCPWKKRTKSWQTTSD
ncbi:hypothetical protein L3Q82_010411, partial [Scortum barcoo]